MDSPPTFRICEPSTPFTFKDRAGFPRTNGGRTLCSDLTPEIYPPLQRTLFLFLFRSDDPHAVGNFGWDPTINDASPPSFAHFPPNLGRITSSQWPRPLSSFSYENSCILSFATCILLDAVPPELTLFLFFHRCTL